MKSDFIQLMYYGTKLFQDVLAVISLYSFLPGKKSSTVFSRSVYHFLLPNIFLLCNERVISHSNALFCTVIGAKL